jgi:hypothetical protein
MQDAIKREIERHEGDYAFCGDCSISVEDAFRAGWEAAKRHTTKINRKRMPYNG